MLSAFPPIREATVKQTCWEVRFVPTATASRPDAPQQSISFNDLVGTQQERLGDRQAERLGGREIDDKLELGRLFDRKVSGFRSLENLIDEFTRVPE
jgi:hypothetical protein